MDDKVLRVLLAETCNVARLYPTLSIGDVSAKAAERVRQWVGNNSLESVYNGVIRDFPGLAYVNWEIINDRQVES